MFTLRDLLDQVEIQGRVQIKNITAEGEVVIVFAKCGGIEALYPKYLEREIVYIYADSEGYLNIEIRE